MTARHRQPLPPVRQDSLLAALLRAYPHPGLLPPEALGRVPAPRPRFRAVLAARDTLLSEAFLDGASDAEFRAALAQFYEACLQPALHPDVPARRAGVLRHALGHLLRSPDPVAQKLERCL